MRLEPVILATNIVPGGTLVFSNAPNVIGGSPLNGVDAGIAGSFIGGGGFGGLYVDQGAGYVFLGSYSNRISSSLGTISGGYSNHIQTNATTATIGGGNANTIQSGAGASVIGGGSGNNISNASNAKIGGGSGNRIETGAHFATIAGGVDNNIAGATSTIGGGDHNTNHAITATIGGGSRNFIGPNASGATVSGGIQNTANGPSATAPGGEKNTASGNHSFAAGYRAKALQDGTFVWADDSSAVDFASTGAYQFLIRAAGGVGIGTATTPPGGLRVHSGGLAVTGASSPNYGGSAGVFTEYGSPYGQIFAFDYSAFVGRSLILNGPGGSVGVGRIPSGPANAFEVEGGAGKTTAGSWAANSDARIKTDVRTVTHALEKLEQVRPVEFRYTKEYRAKHPSIEDRPYLNVVAQEFQRVFPEAVKSSGEKLPDGDDILQVDTYPLTIYSAAAIQELNRAAKEKDAEILDLKSRLERLEKLVISKSIGAE